LPTEVTEQFSSLKDVRRIVTETISQVRRGDLDHETANSIGNLCGVLVRILAQGEFEDRLRELEALASRAKKETQTNGQPT